MTKDVILKKLGERISQIRKEKGLTQIDLAARTQKDQQSIQRLEKGKINPSYFYLFEIAKGLEIELKDLMDIEN